MTAAGWTLLIFSWSAVVALNAFCVWKMIKLDTKKEKEN